MAFTIVFDRGIEEMRLMMLELKAIHDDQMLLDANQEGFKRELRGMKELILELNKEVISLTEVVENTKDQVGIVKNQVGEVLDNVMRHILSQQDVVSHLSTAAACGVCAFLAIYVLLFAIRLRRQSRSLIDVPTVPMASCLLCCTHTCSRTRLRRQKTTRAPATTAR